MVAVILFLILGGFPRIGLLTLGLSLYLAAIELRALRSNYLWWIWWLLLVLMLHFPAYLILRGYSFYAKRQIKRART